MSSVITEFFAVPIFVLPKIPLLVLNATMASRINEIFDAAGTMSLMCLCLNQPVPSGSAL